MKPNLKIAIIGTRGIPARYGGFETFAENLSSRLSRRGHEVVVYGRKGYAENGRLPSGAVSRILPSIRTKHMETVSHGIFSALDASRMGFDACIVCNQSNAFALPILSAAGIATVLCVDGHETQRAKWGMAARSWLNVCLPIIKRMPDTIIADAKVIASYWKPISKVPVEMITYGVEERPETEISGDNFWGLKPNNYILYVSRLEPENNAHLVVEAFKKVKTSMPLVIVGDAPYSRGYISGVKTKADPRVIFTGGVYGSVYRQLMRNCFTYIQATEVGGTHPALLEGLAWSDMVLAHDTPENREVAGDGALYFGLRDSDSLADNLQNVIDQPEIRDSFQLAAHKRMADHYNWSDVVDSYESLLIDLSCGKEPKRFKTSYHEARQRR